MKAWVSHRLESGEDGKLRGLANRTHDSGAIEPWGLIANAAGTIKPPREVEDRLHEIRTGLESSSGVQFVSPSENVADEVVSVLRTLHDPDYLDALRLTPHPQEPEITELATRYAAHGRSRGRRDCPSRRG